VGSTRRAPEHASRAPRSSHEGFALSAYDFVGRVGSQPAKERVNPTRFCLNKKKKNKTKEKKKKERNTSS